MPWALLLVLAPPQAPQPALRDLIAGHCIECHSGKRPKAELDLAAWIEAPGELDADFAVAHAADFERVRDVLFDGAMPPPSRPRPPDALLDDALRALERSLPRRPSTAPSLRRLNRAQYERSIADLLDVHYPARELFPPDDVGARFDNDAAAAGAGDLAVERWIEAAERIADRALPPLSAPTTTAFGPADLEAEGGANRRRDEIAMYSSGAALARYTAPRDGRFLLRLQASGDLAGDEAPRLEFSVDGRAIQTFDVTAKRSQPQLLELELRLEGGPRELRARFVNDFYVAPTEGKKAQDRNLHLFGIEVQGPLDPPAPTSFTRWVDERLASGSFRGALSALTRRMWRREAAPAELARLEELAGGGDDERERLRRALVGLLASPNFLYRVERTRDGGGIDGYERATRLAYFLWASAPDEALLESARSSRLDTDAEYLAQIERLLKDARSRSLVEEFAAQWLGWRTLEESRPDPRTYPEADAALLASMRQECEAFFEAMLREPRPLEQFLDADFVFVDPRLARLYGIEGVRGEGLRRVAVPRGSRGGLLGQAGLLTATSNPTRTSPVKRGKWVLETLLGEVVPPPPPGVGALVEGSAGESPASLHAQLALHRADPACASCHAALDPLGLAMENFDAIGRWRELSAKREEAAARDAANALDDGTALAGVEDLRRYLVARDRFPRALLRALFAYALGREATRTEERQLLARFESLPRSERTVAAAIHAVCLHPSFREAPPP